MLKLSVCNHELLQDLALDRDQAGGCRGRRRRRGGADGLDRLGLLDHDRRGGRRKLSSSLAA